LFFEGAPEVPGAAGSEGDAPSPAYVNEFVSSSEGLRLIGAFIRLDSTELRRSIVGLVEEIALRDGK
jgi:hypothetical protein